jgi:hypothetical protein
LQAHLAEWLQRVSNPDGSVRSLNGFGEIVSVNATGRDYDERYFQLGLRFSF